MTFNGDDGCIERILTLSSEARCNDIEVEEISTDRSERSFLIKTPNGMVFYFWCSEKSVLLGKALLRKMKDLLIKKPSLAELSGISGSRLNRFATHFRAYLTGSMLASAEASGVLSAAHSDDSSEIHFPPSSSNFQQSLCQHASQGSRTNLIYQGSLVPRFSSCKEKGSSSGRSGARENLKRHESDVPGDKELPILADSIDPSGSGCCQKNKPSEANGTSSFALLKFLNAIGESPELPPHLDQEKLVPSSGPSFSPHYCWCPPVGPAAQYTPQVPISGTDSFILPPLSSLLSSARPSILMSSKPLLNLVDIPSIDFPSLPPEPLVRLPGSQQIPTFTPLMCDPIIHIPVIDASGQGYFFSAGPTISSTISPLNTSIIDPLLPSSESLVEKSARETLRMLISSSSNLEENVVVGGRRGLYSGTQDDVLLSEAGGMNRSFDNSSDSKENESSCGPWISDERVDENR